MERKCSLDVLRDVNEREGGRVGSAEKEAKERGFKRCGHASLSEQASHLG